MRDDLDIHLPNIAAGDGDAFARWLAVAEPDVRESLRGFATSVDVEAVLQETLLRIWQVAPKVQVTGPNSLLRLAMRIARNMAIDHTRKRRSVAVDPSLLDKGSEITLPERRYPVGDPLLREHINACRDRLPKKPRAVLMARLESGGAMDDRALAASLGMRLNTMFQNFGRARRLLAKCLEQRGVNVRMEAG